MPLLAYHKGALIPDFQSAATAETLVRNAERCGLDPREVEVRKVTDPEFAAALKPYQDAALAEQAAREAETLKRGEAALKRLGVTIEDFAALIALALKRLG